MTLDVNYVTSEFQHSVCHLSYNSTTQTDAKKVVNLPLNSINHSPAKCKDKHTVLNTAAVACDCGAVDENKILMCY